MCPTEGGREREGGGGEDELPSPVHKNYGCTHTRMHTHNYMYIPLSVLVVSDEVFSPFSR